MVPDVSRLELDTLVAHDGRPYMERYMVRAGTRIHHFVESDPGSDLHDHPWSFTSLILAGAYREHLPTGHVDRRVGDVIHHDAHDLHRVELLTADVWTLFVHDEASRRWGFATVAGWIRWDLHPQAGHWESSGPRTPTPSRSW